MARFKDTTLSESEIIRIAREHGVRMRSIAPGLYYVDNAECGSILTISTTYGGFVARERYRSRRGRKTYHGTVLESALKSLKPYVIKSEE